MFPAGLKFTNRRADAEREYFFDCARLGHSRVRRRFATRGARERYVSRHDAVYHDDIIAGRLGLDVGPTVEQGIAAFLAHLHELGSRGKRDKKTVRYYEGICAHLLDELDAGAPLGTITRRAALEYVKKRIASGSTSQGERLIKELKAIRRIQKFMDVPVSWEIPRDEIGPVHAERQSIGIEAIRDFLRAMAPDSVEYAFAMTKIITLLRNEEIYSLNVGDFRMLPNGAGEITYRLRNKQVGPPIYRTTHVPARLAALLDQWRRRRRRDAPLLHLRGRRLGESSCRKRFIAASGRATGARRKLDPEAAAVKITAIGQFRHEGSTLAHEELGRVEAVSSQLAHTTAATFERHYKLRQAKKAAAESRLVTETVEGKVSGK